MQRVTPCLCVVPIEADDLAQLRERDAALGGTTFAQLLERSGEADFEDAFVALAFGADVEAAS